jgi:hypothetical protein
MTDSTPVSQTTPETTGYLEPIGDALPLNTSAETLAYIQRLHAEIADLRCSVIAFGAPAMEEYARERGLPKGHLYPTHYDILERAGARMVSFTRAVGTGE